MGLISTYACLGMGGCFWVDDQHIPRHWNWIPTLTNACKGIHFVWPYKENQRSYCMCVADHNIASYSIHFL